MKQIQPHLDLSLQTRLRQAVARPTLMGPLACLFLAACGSDLSVAPAPPPPAASFAPSQGVVPIPSDLLLSGSMDLTFSIPGVDDGSNLNASPVEVALSAMDGWSTTAPITINFNTGIEATSLTAGTSVRIFEVTLVASPTQPVGGPVDTVVTELVGDTDFSVGLAPEIADGTAVRIYPLIPFKSRTSYMWVLTDAVTNEAGMPLAKTGEYLLASSTDLFPMTAPIFPLQVLVNAQLAATTGAGINRDSVALTNVFTTQNTTTILDTLAAVVGGSEAGVIATLCGNLPSGCAGEVTTDDPNNLSSLSVTTPSTITTADRVTGSPGLADLYTGGLTVPYYLTAASNPSDTEPVINTDPLTQPMQARFTFAPGVTEKHLTSFNPLPATTGQETIPVLISIPNGMSGQTKPAAGWPVVVFQHGITRNRLDQLALADQMAAAGIMMVSIDLPLHGSTDSSDSILFAGYNAALPGPRERIFGLDLLNAQGLSGPNNSVDVSGAHFINLSNLLVARGNLAQAVSDLLHLTAQIPTLDYDGGGADVDPARLHFVGHSLGAMVGIPFLRQASSSYQSATLAMPGGGILKLFNESPAFGPQLEVGLNLAGVFKGTADYESFLWGAQTVLDPVDPVNYATQLGASGLPIHFIEVVGGGPGGGLPDATVPNTVPFAPLSGSEPLITLMGLNSIFADTVDGGGIQGAVRFIEGAHGSLISPAFGGAAFSEMQLETVEFAEQSGTMLTLVDESVIDTTP